MSKGYEIKKINGEDVFVAKVNENFWLFNDVCICLAGDWEYNETDVESFLDLKNDRPFIVYDGVGSKEFVMMPVYDNYFVPEVNSFDYLRDKNLCEKILEIYDEYRGWAGTKI